MFQRKLRTFEKKPDFIQKSVDETIDGDLSVDITQQHKTKSSCSDDESSLKTITVFSAESTAANTNTKNTPQEIPEETIGSGVGVNPKEQPSKSASIDENKDKIILSETGLLLLHENHPEYLNLIRLQLENLELIQWKSNLQTRINMERSELVKVRNILSSESKIILANDCNTTNSQDYDVVPTEDGEYEKIITQYMKENALLEHKRDLLARDIYEETAELIQLQVELNLQKYKL